MTGKHAGIEGLGRGDFVDEAAAGIKVRPIRSGKEKISSARPGSPGPGGEQRGLKAEIIADASGRLGWRVRIPGSRPLATPAIARGKVFLGGGFGSHEFYAFDLDTGRPAWSLRTKDDGPTAATLSKGFAAFNTESCTVYVVDAERGRVVWERWLGDPLLAQPAIDDDVLTMVYPDRERRHWLAAFGLGTGKDLWRTEIVADVISAPIAAEGSLYAATYDGTVYHLDPGIGQQRWAFNHRATSAPWIHRGKVYLSLRDEEGRGAEKFTTEGIDTVFHADGLRSREKAYSRRKAEYFRQAAGPTAGALYSALDAGVGFAAAPQAAKLHMAEQHLGFGRVSSAWSFQGSRPEVFDDGIFNVMDEVVQRLELGTKKPIWRSRLEFEEKDLLGRAFSPPAVTERRLYLTSALGDLVVLDRASGEELWSLNVGSQIISQPAAAEGKVAFGTVSGELYVFESDDSDSKGWPMWGGGPGHNGPV